MCCQVKLFLVDCQNRGLGGLRGEEGFGCLNRGLGGLGGLGGEEGFGCLNRGLHGLRGLRGEEG